MSKLLIVVDYQNDFVCGSLGFDGAQQLEEGIARKICDYKAAGDTVVFTMDSHQSDYLQTQEGRKLPVEHCLHGTWGWSLYGVLGELCWDNDIVFCKPTFGSLELLDFVKDKQYSSVELVGLVSNICVLANAVLVKTALPEVPVIVDALCTACHDPQLNQKALDVMEGLQIEVINRR